MANTITPGSFTFSEPDELDRLIMATGRDSPVTLS